MQRVWRARDIHVEKEEEERKGDEMGQAAFKLLASPLLDQSLYCTYKTCAGESPDKKQLNKKIYIYAKDTYPISGHSSRKS